MKGRLIWSLVVGAVAGLLFTMPAKAEVLYIDTTMPVIDSTRIITTPVVEVGSPMYVVDTTPTVITTPVSPVYTSPVIVPERQHFLRLGIGPLFEFGLF